MFKYSCVLYLAFTAALLSAQDAQRPTPPAIDPRFIQSIVQSVPPEAKTFPLYNDSIPNSKPAPDEEKADGFYGAISSVSRPTIECFLPAKGKANGSSLVIYPGGGYVNLSMALEGRKIAEDFRDHGIAAFLVKYRLPNDKVMQDKSIGPLQDGQRAIMFVRQHAEEWSLDDSKVGVIGFSAGGHLAASVGTHFDRAYISNPEKTNLRPDFMILVYPVISMTSKVTHVGSQEALLGSHPNEALIGLLSNEEHVDDKTPPTLILAAADDHLVDVDNSILFFEAMRHHDRPVDMTIFRKGDHGFFLMPRDQWESLIFDWLYKNDWISGK